MDKNELKKELLKNKVEALFSHYCAGSLYYTFIVENGTFMFPIETTEMRGKGHVDMNGNPIDTIELSSDLGTTKFPTKEKASMLWRWIDKAMENGECIKLD